MEVLKEYLAKLLKIKSLVTVSVMAVFVIMSLRGDVPSDNVMDIVLIVISFYFGTQHEKVSKLEK